MAGRRVADGAGSLVESPTRHNIQPRHRHQTHTQTNGNDDTAVTDDTISTTGPPKKKKYVRVMTDKRREQNRRAQKLYKERLKRKLEDLQGLAQVLGGGGGGGGDGAAAATTTLPTTTSTKRPTSTTANTNSSPRRSPTDTITTTTNEAKTSDDYDDCASNIPRQPSLPSSSSSPHTQNSASSSSNPIPHMRNQVDTYPPSSSSSFSSSIPTSINLADAFTAAGDLPFTSGPVPGIAFSSGQDISTPSASEAAPAPTPAPFLTYDALRESARRSKHPNPVLSPDPNLDPSLLRNSIHEDLNDLDLRHIWRIPPRSPSQVYTPPHHNNDKHKIRDQQSTAMILTPQSNPYSPRSGVRSRSGSTGFSAFGTANGRGSNNHIHFTPVAASHLPPPPDPYSNHMRLWLEDNIEASIALASAVGISRSEYINDHPSRFPGCYLKLNQPGNNSIERNIAYTGFDYSRAAQGVLQQVNKWPSGTAATAAAAANIGRSLRTGMLVTQELKDHMDRVQPALRPTPAQLLLPHPSYLDCIVFPFVREAAILASAKGQLDHVGLFMDLMNGGMVCWGGGSGASTRAARRDMGDGSSTRCSSRGGMRRDVAWDTRSWEAKKWFLKKWEWLVGSEEEEERRGDLFGIWRASRWWWSMRGEDDDEEEEEEEEPEVVVEVEVGRVCDKNEGCVGANAAGFDGLYEGNRNGQDGGLDMEGVEGTVYHDLVSMSDGQRVTEIDGHCL
ncbi:hypothetical protein PV08_03916 [Exophiala spinifera]|uniref:BZIP domain-containing protein n=1 Tax=Exophiala spinifera TaxID=91928 RepID=A0A0D1ZVI2_9EURO|nr:uncharacterized protein PV08_03916 [Exophiala spinifera]KIW16727.1 hypothetical protein PV08_03916 [Exophiala spinifera]